MARVKDFGAAGDSAADDPDAIQHAVESGAGLLGFGLGNYRICKTIPADLARNIRTSLSE